MSSKFYVKIDSNVLYLHNAFLDIGHSKHFNLRVLCSLIHTHSQTGCRDNLHRGRPALFGGQCPAEGHFCTLTAGIMLTFKINQYINNISLVNSKETII